jgi:hypothetical protein
MIAQKLRILREWEKKRGNPFYKNIPTWSQGACPPDSSAKGRHSTVDRTMECRPSCLRRPRYFALTVTTMLAL